MNLARMLGPAIGGGLIAVAGAGVQATGYVILLNAASYVAVLVSLWSLDRPASVAPAVARQPGQIRAGVRYIREHRQLLLIIAIAGWVGLWAMNFQLTIALMATRVFDRGAGDFGLLASALAVGSMAGALLATRREQPRLRLVVASAVGLGTTQVILGAMPSYTAYAALLPVCGLLAMTTIMSMSTFVQLNTADHVRGRVVAIYMMMLTGGTPIGAPTLGWVADRFGARWTLYLGGSMAVVGTVVITFALARDQVGPTIRERRRGDRAAHTQPLVEPTG